MKPDHPPLYLQACHHRNFSGCDDKTLRGSLKDYGIDGKRLSRFSLMSLLVAMPLAGQIGADCSIILAAPFSSPRRFLPTFLQHAQDGTPSPLGFAASLHNAPAFQLAQALGSRAGMIFLATDEHNFWQPLWLGINDLLAGSAKQCCISWLYETPNPAANEAEHAVSLLLSTTAPDTPSTATIRIATDAAPCTPDLSATANATYPALLSRWVAALSADETLILSDRGLPPKLRIMLR